MTSAPGENRTAYQVESNMSPQFVGLNLISPREVLSLLLMKAAFREGGLFLEQVTRTRRTRTWIWIKYARILVFLVDF